MDKIPGIKSDICKRVNRMVGYNVVGLGDLLSILTGPDVLPQLEKLVAAVKEDRNDSGQA